MPVHEQQDFPMGFCVGAPFDFDADLDDEDMEEVQKRAKVAEQVAAQWAAAKRELDECCAASRRRKKAKKQTEQQTAAAAERAAREEEEQAQQRAQSMQEAERAMAIARKQADDVAKAAQGVAAGHQGR